MMVNAALLTLLAAVPRYFLERYAGSEALGYFGSISTPAVIIQAGCSFIYTPLVAPLTERFAEARWSDFKKMVLTALAGILGFAVCMFIGAALLGRWGLSLLFGEAILPYAYLLVPVLGTTLCISLIYFFDVLLTIGMAVIMTGYSPCCCGAGSGRLHALHSHLWHEWRGSGAVSLRGRRYVRHGAGRRKDVS